MENKELDRIDILYGFKNFPEFKCELIYVESSLKDKIKVFILKLKERLIDNFNLFLQLLLFWFLVMSAFTIVFYIFHHLFIKGKF